jgi:CNT family concentrative nucleoside transporter
MWVFARLNDLMMALLGFTRHGTDFLFGSFLTGRTEPGLVNLAFQVLPTIIFFSSLMAVGYQLGVMQRIVKLFAFVMHRTMRCSGAETLSTAANIFVGQTEAPLVVKPYLEKMTQSELMAVMVGGFANTAGGVLAAYVGMLSPYFPDIAGHLIAQSVMSAPATLVCAKILFPETEETVSGDHLEIQPEKIDANVLDAAARGASEGLSLALNVFAMLLAFIALIAMVNAGLRHLGLWAGFSGLTLENILGVPDAAIHIARYAVDGIDRSSWAVPLVSGEGRYISTYGGADVKPTPSFSGEPLAVSLNFGDAKTAAKACFDALAPSQGDADYRVGTIALYIKDGYSNIAIVNKL